MLFHIICLEDALGYVPVWASAIGVNNPGVVVGSYVPSATDSTVPAYSFLYDTGGVLVTGIGLWADFQSLNRQATFTGVRFLDINDKGVIVGRIDFTNQDQTKHSYAFQLLQEDATKDVTLDKFRILREPPPPSGSHPHPPPAGSANSGRWELWTRALLYGGTSFHAHGINNLGHVVGIFRNAANEVRGFHFRPYDESIRGTWIGEFKLVDAEREFTQLFGINDAGFIAGSTGDYVDAAKTIMRNEMFVWDPAGNSSQLSVATNINGTTINTKWGIAHKINNKLVVVGEASQDPMNVSATAPMLAWQTVFNPASQDFAQPLSLAADPSGSCKDNGNPREVVSYTEAAATGLNDHHEIVGQAKPPTAPPNAVAWISTEGGGPRYAIPVPPSHP
jgi:probable HAF family extracellular repeat protein